MAIRCRIFRGLVLEAEEDITKFLAAQEVRVLHLAQSESGNHISVTMIVDEPGVMPDEGF